MSRLSLQSLERLTAVSETSCSTASSSLFGSVLERLAPVNAGAFFDVSKSQRQSTRLLRLWRLQGLPWHHISRWRPQYQSAQQASGGKHAQLHKVNLATKRIKLDLDR